MSQTASTDKRILTEQYSSPKSEQNIRKEYLVQIEQGEDGWIVAKCPELGVVTQGKTIDELQQNAIEAIELALDNDKQFTLRMVEKSSV